MSDFIVGSSKRRDAVLSAGDAIAFVGKDPSDAIASINKGGCAI
jgi:hypothetical protein